MSTRNPDRAEGGRAIANSAWSGEPGVAARRQPLRAPPLRAAYGGIMQRVLAPEPPDEDVGHDEQGCGDDQPWHAEHAPISTWTPISTTGSSCTATRWTFGVTR